MKMMKMIPESKIRQSGKANNKKNSFFQSQLLRRKKKKNASNVDKNEKSDSTKITFNSSFCGEKIKLNLTKMLVASKTEKQCTSC